MALNPFLDSTARQLLIKLKLKYLGKDRLYKSELSEYFSQQLPCVFVLSTGRVGTQTLASLLNLANNNFSYHEPEPKLYGLSNCFYRSEAFYKNDWALMDVLKEAFLIARLHFLNYSIQFGKGYIETSPQITFLAPIVSALIPQARFIHFVRDPRSVIRSGMRRNWYGGNVNDKTRIIPDQATDIGRQWSNYSLFQKNAWLWAETNRKIEEFLGEIIPDQKILIHSEASEVVYSGMVSEKWNESM